MEQPYQEIATQEQERITNFTNALKQAVSHRTDIPFPSQPETTWAQAVNQLETLFNNQGIELRTVPGEQKIKSGFYSAYQPPIINTEFMAKHFVLALEIPRYPKDPNNYGYTNNDLAYLVQELLVQHHLNLNKPNRLTKLSKDYQLADIILPSGPGAKYLDSNPLVVPLDIPSTQDASPLPQPEISPEINLAQPLDLLNRHKPEDLKNQLSLFWGKLTKQERQVFIDNKHAAISLLAVILGIKPATIRERLSSFAIPSIIEKSGLIFQNGVWLNPHATKNILKESGFTNTEDINQLINLLSPFTVDINLTRNQMITRGILLGYGKENAQDYANHYTQSKKLSRTLGVEFKQTSTDWVTAILEKINTPFEDKDLVVKYFQKLKIGTEWKFVVNNQQTVENILNKQLGPHGFSPQSVKFLLFKRGVDMLGDRHISTLSPKKQKQMALEINRILDQIGLNQLLKQLV